MTTSPSMARGKTGRTIGIGVAAVLLLASAACGGSSDSASTGSGGGGATSAAQVKEASELATKAQTAPTQINSTVPLAKAPEPGTKAVYLLDPNPANTLIGKSFQEAVESAGWDAEQIPYNVADPATVQAALKTALSKGAKFVGEAGLPADVFGESVIKSYANADAKIVIGSIFPKANTDTINTDAGGGEARYETGKALAAWFVADSDGKGKAIVENLSAYPILAEFVRGFTDEVDRLCPGCSVEVAKFTPSDLAGGKINPSLVSKLRNDKSVDYLFFDNSGFATGIDSALKAAGLTKVKVGGSGIDSNAVDAIKKGTQHAWIGTSWFYQGYAMADAAFRIQTGTTEGSDENGDQPFQLFTKDNVDQLDGEYDAPKDALAQFQKLWGVEG